MLFGGVFRLISKYLKNPFLVKLGKGWVSLFTLWITEHKKFGFSSVLTERKMFQFGSVHCWTGSPLSEKRY